MTKDRIDMNGFLIILLLTILWGLNYPAVKVSNTGLSPVFTTFLRSVIATFFGVIYCLVVKQPLFHRGTLLFHGAMVGILFGIEFVFLYIGLLYTNAARAAIFVYLSPFVVAIGAHLFLKERLNSLKITGLILAFLGIFLVFKGKPTAYNRLMFVGDLCEIMAAIFWGATTIYIKKYLAQRVHPINTFLYQLAFSIPIILIGALLLEDTWIKEFSMPVISSLFYQSVVVAFASYLAWFKLIHVYPVAQLSIFTFLTPIFGVLSGVIFMKDQLTMGLLLGLIVVCIGIYLTNYQKRQRAQE
ncbi:MAG: DMT(drug/metabolite transporter) superfamily permease [Deltaproteobacteria bacterium]|jgi:drug/metabolite transporter (DMT)-like permease|nr:DMT(drug/metabolite transporter) superfamily permease [Deltaproteobacteria bacterium]